MVSAPIALEKLSERPGMSLRMFLLMFQLLRSNASQRLKSRRRRIRTNFIVGGSIADNEVSRIIYEEFLPTALGEGQYIPAPDPHVVGTGLDCIQAALDFQRKGVSAKKVAVSL